MANLKLPIQIDPIQLADQSRTLKGDFALFEMERLKEMICNSEEGVASIELKFGRDQQRILYIKGVIQTTLSLLCQRCNKPMQKTLVIDVNLAIVNTNEEADKLPETYEPIILTEETISLVSMVEEEILLSIPIVPKHSAAECGVKSAELIEKVVDKKKDKSNPFTVLKKLLRE